MCGIAGFVSPDPAPLRSAADAMLDAVAYRGPDARGQWTDGAGATLLHARLSIIDLECGGQPMTDVTGRYTIVFNGAIYNFVELRREYEAAGARFATHSDTEVLLNGFALKGEGVLADLNGMFAFAIWDSIEHRLFMARDRLGKKPLYWAMAGETLLFASSAAAFNRVPNWSSELSQAGLILYSFLGAFPGEMTAFASVKALPAAHFAWFRPGTTAPITHRYWRLHYGVKARGGLETHLDEYRFLLASAVALRLRSDVPVGLSFSGGVDSGSIAAVAKTHAGVDLRCFTIDYDTPDEPSAEVALARRVANRLGLPWQHIQYDYRTDLLGGLPDAYANFDQPCQQLALVYSRRLYDVMSSHCKVVLSGNGADELFAGYAGDIALPAFDRKRWWLRRVPDALFNRLNDDTRQRWGHIRLNRLTLPAWARQDMFAYARTFTDDAAVLDQCRSAIDALIRDCAEASIDTMMDFVMHRALLVSAADTNYRLPDITGYAAHVEVRSPFLDHRLVEFAARLPHRLKVGGFAGRTFPKRLARIAYGRMVGEEIAAEPKRNMGANLMWHLEFARNPQYVAALERAYALLPAIGIDSTMFERAYREFRAAALRGDAVFPSGGTMMNGFMLGAWLELVHGRRSTAA